jgi:hypothetical protein
VVYLILDTKLINVQITWKMVNRLINMKIGKSTKLHENWTNRKMVFNNIILFKNNLKISKIN